MIFKQSINPLWRGGDGQHHDTRGKQKRRRPLLMRLAVLFLMTSSTPCTNPLFFKRLVCSLSLRHAAASSAQGVLCQVERSCFVLSEVAPSSGLGVQSLRHLLRTRSLARSARSLSRITATPLKSFHVPTVSPRSSPAKVTACSAILSR